jgi:hypothetical protein
VADDCAMWMARQAAELLPEAPPIHDSFGYLAWEELVISVAERLRPFLATSAAPVTEAPQPRLSPASGRLTPTFLLTLASALDQDAAVCSCEALLFETVASVRSAESGSVLVRHH